jgi:RES domain-containing protein
VATVVAFRLATWDTPLWSSPNRRDSRFQTAGSGVVQYWSLHPLTCWAELLRFHGIRAAEEVRELRSRPWVAHIEIPDDAVELTFDNASSHGISPESLIDDDWAPCQRWAETLDVTAITVPSAALPGTRNLVLFGERVRSRWGLPPFDPGIDIPCDPVANLGDGIADLLPSVRWRGTPHAGYVAWSRSERQPDPPRVRLDRQG